MVPHNDDAIYEERNDRLSNIFYLSYLIPRQNKFVENLLNSSAEKRNYFIGIERKCYCTTMASVPSNKLLSNYCLIEVVADKRYTNFLGCKSMIENYINMIIISNHRSFGLAQHEFSITRSENRNILLNRLEEIIKAYEEHAYYLRLKLTEKERMKMSPIKSFNLKDYVSKKYQLVINNQGTWTSHVKLNNDMLMNEKRNLQVYEKRKVTSIHPELSSVKDLEIHFLDYETISTSDLKKFPTIPKGSYHGFIYSMMRKNLNLDFNENFILKYDNNDLIKIPVAEDNTILFERSAKVTEYEYKIIAFDAGIIFSKDIYLQLNSEGRWKAMVINKDKLLRSIEGSQFKYNTSAVENKLQNALELFNISKTKVKIGLTGKSYLIPIDDRGNLVTERAKVLVVEDTMRLAGGILEEQISVETIDRYELDNKVKSFIENMNKNNWEIAVTEDNKLVKIPIDVSSKVYIISDMKDCSLNERNLLHDINECEELKGHRITLDINRVLVKKKIRNLMDKNSFELMNKKKSNLNDSENILQSTDKNKTNGFVEVEKKETADEDDDLFRQNTSDLMLEEYVTSIESSFAVESKNMEKESDQELDDDKLMNSDQELGKFNLDWSAYLEEELKPKLAKATYLVKEDWEDDDFCKNDITSKFCSIFNDTIKQGVISHGEWLEEECVQQEIDFNYVLENNIYDNLDKEMIMKTLNEEKIGWRTFEFSSKFDLKERLKNLIQYYKDLGYYLFVDKNEAMYRLPISKLLSAKTIDLVKIPIDEYDIFLQQHALKDLTGFVVDFDEELNTFKKYYLNLTGDDLLTILQNKVSKASTLQVVNEDEERETDDIGALLKNVAIGSIHDTLDKDMKDIFSTSSTFNGTKYSSKKYSTDKVSDLERTRSNVRSMSDEEDSYFTVVSELERLHSNPRPMSDAKNVSASDLEKMLSNTRPMSDAKNVSASDLEKMLSNNRPMSDGKTSNITNVWSNSIKNVSTDHINERGETKEIKDMVSTSTSGKENTHSTKKLPKYSSGIRDLLRKIKYMSVRRHSSRTNSYHATTQRGDDVIPYKYVHHDDYGSSELARCDMLINGYECWVLYNTRPRRKRQMNMQPLQLSQSNKYSLNHLKFDFTKRYNNRLIQFHFYKSWLSSACKGKVSGLTTNQPTMSDCSGKRSPSPNKMTNHEINPDKKIIMLRSIQTSTSIIEVDLEVEVNKKELLHVNIKKKMSALELASATNPVEEEQIDSVDIPQSYQSITQKDPVNECPVMTGYIEDDKCEQMTEGLSEEQIETEGLILIGESEKNTTLNHEVDIVESPSNITQSDAMRNFHEIIIDNEEEMAHKSEMNNEVGEQVGRTSSEKLGSNDEDIVSEKPEVKEVLVIDDTLFNNVPQNESLLSTMPKSPTENDDEKKKQVSGETVETFIAEISTENESQFLKEDELYLSNKVTEESVQKPVSNLTEETVEKSVAEISTENESKFPKEEELYLSNKVTEESVQKPVSNLTEGTVEKSVAEISTGNESKFPKEEELHLSNKVTEESVQKHVSNLTGGTVEKSIAEISTENESQFTKGKDLYLSKEVVKESVLLTDKNKDQTDVEFQNNKMGVLSPTMAATTQNIVSSNDTRLEINSILSETANLTVDDAYNKKLTPDKQKIESFPDTILSGGSSSDVTCSSSIDSMDMEQRILLNRLILTREVSDNQKMFMLKDEDTHRLLNNALNDNIGI